MKLEEFKEDDLRRPSVTRTSYGSSYWRGALLPLLWGTLPFSLFHSSAGDHPSRRGTDCRGPQRPLGLTSPIPGRFNLRPQGWCGTSSATRPAAFSPSRAPPLPSLWLARCTIHVTSPDADSGHALQDASYDNDDTLSHCRGGGPHRGAGCWSDLVLGKA